MARRLPGCKLYRAGEGGALYAGVLKAAGARAFVEAIPGAEFRYRNVPLRRMTAGELAAAVDPERVYDYDLLGAEEQAAPLVGPARRGSADLV